MIYQIAYDGSTKDNCVYPCIMNDKVTPYFESKIIHDFVKNTELVMNILASYRTNFLIRISE